MDYLNARIYLALEDLLDAVRALNEHGIRNDFDGADRIMVTYGDANKAVFIIKGIGLDCVRMV